jgi:acetylornithine/succinyldiaminopimelate/putrescine aminotransferase
MAKPLANGFPIGAIMITDKVAEKIAIGKDCFFLEREEVHAG